MSTRIRVQAGSRPSQLQAAVRAAAQTSPMHGVAASYWDGRANAAQTRDPAPQASSTAGHVGAEAMAGISANYWQGRAGETAGGRGSSTEGSSGAAGVRGSRRLPTGRAGFTVDPARLETFRRRKAGVAGAYNAAIEDVAKATRAVEIARHNALAQAKGANPEYYANLLKEAEATLATANAALSRSNDESQSILGVAERAERYVAALREEATDEARRVYEEVLHAPARATADQEDAE